MLVRINKPLFATLLFIGCLSSNMPVAAAAVPALGGYTTRVSMIYRSDRVSNYGLCTTRRRGLLPLLQWADHLLRPL